MTIEEYLSHNEGPLDMERFTPESQGRGPRGDSTRRQQQSRQGTLNNHQGEALEEFLIAHGRAVWEGLGATLVEVPARYEVWRGAPELTRLVRARNAKASKHPDLFLAVPMRRTWVDFILLWGTAHAHFDAKTSTANNPSWRFKASVDPHQMDKLKLQAKRGNVAFFYLRHQLTPFSVAKDYMVPVLPQGFPFAASSQVRWADLEKWRMPARFDALDAVAQWEAYLEGGWSNVEPRLEKIRPFLKQSGSGT